MRAFFLSGAFAVLGLVMAGSCVAGTEDRPDRDGDFWKDLASADWARLYENKEGPIERVDLIGRIDLQSGYIDSDFGSADRLELRRFRLGTEVRFLDEWRLKVVANLVDEEVVSYGSINTATLRYRPSKHFKLTLGKQVAPFGQEWSTPSIDLGVIERSLLTEQVRPSQAVGLNVEGDWNQFDYEVGVFSGNVDRGFGDFDAGLFYVASLGYDFTEIFDYWKDFDVRLYYIYNDGNASNNAAEPYEHAVSAALKLRKNQFRFDGEMIYAEGMEGRADVWGVIATPTWEVIEDKLELVLRYHYAKSDGADGLRLRKRYETRVPDLLDGGRGEEYHSFYVGFRYKIIEDRLLFMAGGEWAEMLDTEGDGGDLDSFSLLSALRIDF
ncbi:MAG: porin [Verrucomicrobia bacterium]|nr:porin [Verrucomicrobiota bacterium]MDA1005749.1 porin [Verrucomicrobiota bacterium]